MNEAMLEIRNLTLGYRKRKPLIEQLGFSIDKGETVCLHGPSGCGKSTVIWAVMGMLEEIGGYAEGEIYLKGKELLHDPKYMEKVRWNTLSLVPQSSMSAFNPVFRLKKTYMELLNLKAPYLSALQKKERMERMMEVVHLNREVLNRYPHELSGGMRQRAAIALALMLDPQVLILDEATTGLDVLVEAEILWTLKQIRKQREMSMLVVSHDTRIAQAFCDRRIEL